MVVMKMMTNIISIISAKHINLIRSKNIDSGIDWSRGGEIETRAKQSGWTQCS